MKNLVEYIVLFISIILLIYVLFKSFSKTKMERFNNDNFNNEWNKEISNFLSDIDSSSSYHNNDINNEEFLLNINKIEKNDLNYFEDDLNNYILKDGVKYNYLDTANVQKDNFYFLNQNYEDKKSLFPMQMDGQNDNFNIYENELSESSMILPMNENSENIFECNTSCKNNNIKNLEDENQIHLFNSEMAARTFLKEPLTIKKKKNLIVQEKKENFNNTSSTFLLIFVLIFIIFVIVFVIFNK